MNFDTFYSKIFDAFESAKARGVDVLIADTAGRLQNKAHLMEELKKIVRVMKKLDPNATLTYFFENFQAIPLTGVYWTQLSKDNHE